MEKKRKKTEHQVDAGELEHQVDAGELDIDIASWALMAAIESRVQILSRPLLPLVERIERGEAITREEILTALESCKVGHQTALQKLEYLKSRK